MDGVQAGNGIFLVRILYFFPVLMMKIYIFIKKLWWESLIAILALSSAINVRRLVKGGSEPN